MKKASIVFAIIALFSLQLIALGGPGTVPAAKASVELAGTVLDKTSGEVLGGVEINVLGTSIHSYTDFDGRFNISGLQPGIYDIVVSYISYEKSLIEKIEVKSGAASSLEIRLISAK